MRESRDDYNRFAGGRGQRCGELRIGIEVCKVRGVARAGKQTERKDIRYNAGIGAGGCCKNKNKKTESEKTDASRRGISGDVAEARRCCDH